MQSWAKGTQPMSFQRIIPVNMKPQLQLTPEGGPQVSVCHRAFWPGYHLFWRHWCFNWAQEMLARPRGGRASQAVRTCRGWHSTAEEAGGEQCGWSSENERGMWWKMKLEEASMGRLDWDSKALLRTWNFILKNRRSCWGVLSRRVTNSNLFFKEILLDTVQFEKTAWGWVLKY